MKVISQRELRNDSGAVLRAVEAGEAMIVTKSGIPVAELRPLHGQTFVPASQWRAALQGLPGVDASSLRADIEAAVDPRVSDPFERS